MSTKLQGTEGVTFPDSTVQGSAAYSKAESDAQNPAVFLRAQSGLTSVGNANVVSQFNSWTKLEEENSGTLSSAGVWTPGVAGLYQINFQVNFANYGVTGSSIVALLHKNGALYSRASASTSAGTIFPIIAGSAVVHLEATGTIQVLAQQNGTAVATNVQAVFTAALVRKT